MGKILDWLSSWFNLVVERILAPLLMPLVEANWFPDFLLRFGIRKVIGARQDEFNGLTVQDICERNMKFVEELRKMPVAIEQTSANEQHYEVPADFYKLVLGPCLKYSGGYWRRLDGKKYDSAREFEQSETDMLDMYCERAQLQDGQTVLDLGCGWGSVTLYIAQKYPNIRVISISNSNSQREFILATAEKRGIASRIRVITTDFSSPAFYQVLSEDGTPVLFDRVISIEMFEHFKNYQALLTKVSALLKPKTGMLFIHIFCHLHIPYHFDTDDGSWMSRNFFSGGTMPSASLLNYCLSDSGLHFARQWHVDGRHYGATANAWVDKLEANKNILIPLFGDIYNNNKDNGESKKSNLRSIRESRAIGIKWYVNWKLFFLACAEMFDINQGQSWAVTHILYQKN